MLNANELLKEGIEQVESMGIEVGRINPIMDINTRAKTRFGRCRKVPNKQYDFEIQINALLLNGDKDKAMNTVVHEILHTCKGCMNHGSLWKQYASIMNRAFGYDISRTSSYEERGLERPKSKYTIKCDGCGQETGRDKRSKLITHIHHYRCKCGGKLSLV